MTRLDNARQELDRCYGKRECQPAIKEYLAALTESQRRIPKPLTGPYIPRSARKAGE